MASRVPLSPRSRLYYGTREWKEKQKRQKRKKERNKREKKRKGRKSLYGEREIEKKRNIFEKRGKCVRACAHICVYKSERERIYIWRILPQGTLVLGIMEHGDRTVFQHHPDVAVSNPTGQYHPRATTHPPTNRPTNQPSPRATACCPVHPFQTNTNCVAFNV